MTREEFFYQCMDVIEHWLNGNRKLSELREVTDKLYNEVTKPHWISVEDEMPPRFVLDPNDSLFVLTYGLHTKVAFYKYDKGEWVGNTEVSHWMPLPQAPTCSEKPNNCEKGGEE